MERDLGAGVASQQQLHLSGRDDEVYAQSNTGKLRERSAWGHQP